MSSGSLFLICALGVLTVASAALTVRLWRDPSRVERAVAAYGWMPFGVEVRRGAVRGSITRVVILAAVTVIVALGSPPPHRTLGSASGAEIVELVLVAVVILAFVVQLSIIAVNRPRWIVPPHMRTDLGVVGERRLAKRQGHATIGR